MCARHPLAVMPCRPSRFYPLPDEVGAGGIGVASDVRPSGRPAVPRPDVRISFPEQNSVTRACISLIFDTHIPYGV